MNMPLCSMLNALTQCSAANKRALIDKLNAVHILFTNCLELRQTIWGVVVTMLHWIRMAMGAQCVVGTVPNCRTVEFCRECDSSSALQRIQRIHCHPQIALAAQSKYKHKHHEHHRAPPKILGEQCAPIIPPPSPPPPQSIRNLPISPLTTNLYYNFNLIIKI